MQLALIIEDNATFRSSFKQMLSYLFPSINLIEASSGNEGFSKFQALGPPLVFIDIRLPGIDGLELTGMIKKIDPDAIVAVLTSYELPEYREAAYKNGANFFFTKGTTSINAIAEIIEASLNIKGVDSPPVRNP